ncbi:MAG TPA: glycoside hydrolase family 2 TIM barrel-domain containing protein [Gemmataceae bacterium]|nr:glycoside hydrolase family 2 TIM barrel-domain containing protein [Gemmataceae bacterium]
MNPKLWTLLIVAASLLWALSSVQAGPPDTPLPSGVTAVWDLSKASRENTNSRDRICLNGLWRWQPARSSDTTPPVGQWGYFKVPGFWPGNNNYIQEDCQTLFAHADWKDSNFRNLTSAWYEREIKIPKLWAGRRIAVSAEYVNSLAIVFIDGRRVGEIRFPAREIDITEAIQPDTNHVLSLLVAALPLKGVLLSYADTNSAKEVKGMVERRGLCGDVYLSLGPRGARISDVKIDTSVRKKQISASVALDGLVESTPYTLSVRIKDGARSIHEFASKPFRAGDIEQSRLQFSDTWLPEKLWDLNTPQNMFTAEVSLNEPDDKLADQFHPVRFGFREFWIAGRDFYLNGSRIFLSAVPIDNAQIGARTATYSACCETMKRLQSFGINFVYTHNYGCEPGTHVSFAELLRAADDTGMLVAFSQPHFGHYDWKAADADRTNGYARHAEFYVHAAQNHPSIIAYSMSHNATGYDEDMNPDHIDGIDNPRGDNWSRNNAALALRAEAIVKRFDSTRVVYHHSSGNLGSMHTMNFYLNFVPSQELSDWFEHWATKGVKPVFTCEYGVPFTWDWTMYRGWYKGERAWGSARVPWEFCLAEWNAQFLGDKAYRIGEAEKRNLRWEAGQFRSGNLWHRWDYPVSVGSSDFDDRQTVIANYLTDNWRAFRTWGVSAISPWEYAAYWKQRDGVGKSKRDLKVDWENLQKPGFSPDFVPPRQGWMSVDGERADWIPTPAAQALCRNNRPLLAYIAGKAEHFTNKDHNFFPGETVEKQLIVINNSRETVSCECEWKFGLRIPAASVHKTISVRTGEQERIPFRLTLPDKVYAGAYRTTATFRFSNGEVQNDNFETHVLTRPANPPTAENIALFDPKGETRKQLAALGINCKEVAATTDLTGFDTLVIGKQALSLDGPGPNLDRVRDGLKVVQFEQSAAVLEQRFGFRVAEYGLRQVFERVPDHPLLARLEEDHWHDWRGTATLSSPRLEYALRPRYGPTVQWCGLDVPRAWRCGCRGNVASVVIEKPARGDFLPILDCGYALQYSPLLEYHEGKGMVLFCQLDVTGRSEADPAAETLMRNIFNHVATWKPKPIRAAQYVGDPAGKRYLQEAGLPVQDLNRENLTANSVLIVGAGGGKYVDGPVQQWLNAGGHILALGIEASDGNAALGSRVAMKKGEYIASSFKRPDKQSPLAGIGPADLLNRDPRELWLVSGGESAKGDGVLAVAENGRFVICQFVPWQFDARTPMNQKRTFRRAAYVIARLSANMGLAGSTPLLARIRNTPSTAEKRWLEGFYLDSPEEWDDPYRFFRW